MNSPTTALAFGRGAAIATSSVLLITIVHHGYRAVRFATPWRQHVTLLAVLLAMALWGAYLILSWRYATPSGRIARAVFFGIALVGPIGWIGQFEGGYNHALKIILFQLDLPAAAVQRYYHPGIYEAPEDWFFETTGVAQLATALWALRSVVHFERNSRRSHVMTDDFIKSSQNL